MKSLKLICLIGLLYSCTTNVNNTNSSIKLSPKPSQSIVSSPTIQPSSSPTSIPSIIISSPSSDYSFRPISDTSPTSVNIKEIEKI
jgi:BRCT domain type II-containing protein